MSQTQTSPEISQQMTQHAMLVIWGLYARRIGLVEAIEAVKLKQKSHVHNPVLATMFIHANLEMLRPILGEVS